MDRDPNDNPSAAPSSEGADAPPQSGLEAAERAPSPYGWAALAGVAVFALYAITVGPTTWFWDTSEYIATAHILGIPHPPGNPLFVLLARSWELIITPIGLPVAVEINLFSALMSAIAHGLWFLVIHRVLSFFAEGRRFAIVGAWMAVLVSATAFTVWYQSNVNEKVYTVSLMTIALLSWLAFLWRDNLDRGKDDNLLVLMVFILALSVGNHLMAFLAAPALGVFILSVHPRTLLNGRLYGAAIVAVIIGLSVHLFMPIRAELNPSINEASPTCESLGGAVASVASYGQFGCENLNLALTRDQYQKPPLVPRQAALHSQYANYLQYFDWQWARSIQGTDTVFAPVRLLFTLLFIGLGVWGATEHFKEDRKSFWYLAILFGTLSVGLVFYLNFRYGYTLQAPVSDRSLHEVRERDYFFICSFSLWGLWAGVGVATLWRDLSRKLGRWSRGAPVLALAFIPLLFNWSWASRSDDYSARDWAYNLLMSVEPYGVLFTNGDNDTFPLWYLQEVEHIRRDVTVIVTSYLNTGWYAKQIRDLTRPCPEGVSATDDPTRIICQRGYTPEDEAAAYTTSPTETEAAGLTPIPLGTDFDRPSRSVLPLEDDVIDQVSGSSARVPSNQTIELGPVTARVESESVFLPWQLFALTIIRNSIDERPIYFASSGNAPVDLGIRRYLVRQGLAFKLWPGDPAETDSIVEMARSPLSPVVGPFVDVERTRLLLEEIFIHRTGIPDDWSFWPDRATIGIPNYYAWAYYALAQEAVQRNDQETMERYRERAEAWSELGS